MDIRKFVFVVVLSTLVSGQVVAQKRKRGRPPVAGEGVKRIMVSLDRASMERARALGGTISAGIRKALAAGKAE